MTHQVKIIGSVTSPFTRIVRVLCEELSIPYDFVITAPFGRLDSEQDAYIATFNPLMKVPALQDGDTLIFDSRIIANYLLARRENEMVQPRPGASLATENTLTVIYGVIDAGILSFMLKASYPGIDAERGYIKRCVERMRSGLAWISKQSTLGDRFGLPEIALMCGLEWFTKRNVIAWQEYPTLVRTHDAFAGRESLLKTAIPTAV
jgi:glutathione S-transferase